LPLLDGEVETVKINEPIFLVKHGDQQADIINSWVEYFNNNRAKTV